MVASSARGVSLAARVVLLAVLATAGLGYAKCDPSTDRDRSDIANARPAVAANCDCTGATSHAAYVSCAAQQANAVLTNKSCAGVVKKCASHSTCGKPNAVTCCITTAAGTKCKIKKDAAHCTAKQGTVGACTSCCDACPAPGAGPSFPMPTATTTTTTTTTSSCPPATALYCGGAECFYGGGVGCGSLGWCPQGMTCSATTCSCTGPAIPCGDPSLRGGLCNFCKWGTCPPGMTCGGVPNGACGWDCACQ
jgi:hypothetical protein